MSRSSPDSATIADHVIDQLTPLSGRRALLGLAVDLGPVDRYLALAHATVGDRHEMRRLREQARVQAGCELWSGRIDRDDAASGGIRPATGGAWSWIESR